MGVWAKEGQTGGWIWLPSGHCRELTFREVTLQWFCHSPGGQWLEGESQAEVWSCKECGGVRGAPEGGQASDSVTCLVGQAKVWASFWRMEEPFWGTRHSRLMLCTGVRLQARSQGCRCGRGVSSGSFFKKSHVLEAQGFPWKFLGSSANF